MDEVLIELISALKDATPEVAKLIIFYLVLKYCSYILVPITFIGVALVITKCISNYNENMVLLKSFPPIWPGSQKLHNQETVNEILEWDRRRQRNLSL